MLRATLALLGPGLLLVAATSWHAWPVLDGVVVLDSLLPRAAVALLCGGALGLAGALAQVALRNPLASPDTLGVAAGAALALALATLFAPGLLAGIGRGVVAAGGGGAGLLLVLALSVRGGLDPAAVALAGVAVGLYAGSIASVLAVLHTHQLGGLFVWEAGSLVQLGWGGVRVLLPVVMLGAVAAALLGRPLAVLSLPDTVARGRGVPVGAVRAAALAISVGLAAAVVGTVGVIGFVGLAAPTLARLGGRFSLLWASLLGAALLLLTDELVQSLPGTDGALLPTGAVGALLGAPLLLWLLPRAAARTARPAPPPPVRLASTGTPILLALIGVLLLAVAAALGWMSPFTAIGAEHATRIVTAAIGGAALAIAGTVLQRVLANPLAGPEVLGLGSGALAGGAVALGLGFDGVLARFGFGAAGAAAVLLLLLLFARGPGAPTRLVLAGIALSAAGQAGLALALASGDPSAETVLLWSAGSTYGAMPRPAMLAAALLVPGGVVAVMARRVLDLLPLGPAVTTALGLDGHRARAGLLTLATALTALGAVLVGPLTFIGLVAPHVARLLGLHRAALQLPAAALAGAAIAVVADTLGRTMLFPYEVPAGLLAALLGGPVLLASLWRRPA